MKTIILARVSTQEQKEAGNSLPAQQARMRIYIERVPRLELDKEFIFDESAYKERRKEFEKGTGGTGVRIVGSVPILHFPHRCLIPKVNSYKHISSFQIGNPMILSLA